MQEEKKKKLKGIIEALLVVASRPLPLREFRDLVSDIEVVPEKELTPLLEELALEYVQQGRSFKLEETAAGYQIRTLAEYAPWLNKLYRERRTERLSQAVLETLAIVAYRQPITKAEVESVRGVDVTGSLKRCLDFDLVEVVGKKEIIGRPFLYGSTQTFLKQFGLKTLDELPQIEELREVGTGQKELDLKEEEQIPTEEEAPNEQEETETVEATGNNKEGNL